MNSCIPDWNFEGDLPLTNQKKPLGPDHELVELLWRNGQVVLHSQTQRKLGLNPNESRQVQKQHDQQTTRVGGFYGNSGNLIHDEVSMTHYPLEDSFDKEFCSNFFSELPSCDPLEIEKPMKQFGEEKFDASNTTHLVSPSPQTNGKSSTDVEYPQNPMPPPRFQISNPSEKNQNLGGGLGKAVHFSQFSASGKGAIGSSRRQVGGKESGYLNQGEVRECSVMTVGSSYSGSNQVPNDFDVSRASSNNDGTTGFSTGPLYNNVQKMMPLSEGGMTETLDPTLTSSSGGSGSSFGRGGKQSNAVNSNKRKGRETEDSECQSKAAELDSAAGDKPAQRSGSSRRTRAAEVHNLSERRRRDRINEKMRALQELIPHSNKTDKASMLDEAIEYLKSLQLQLQVMWMGGGMAPMMFPGVQHYMSRMGMGMGMGMGPPALPSMHNPMQLPRVPLVDQCMTVAPPTNPAVMCQTPVLNPVDYHNQMQNPSFQEQYARLMGFHHMQTMSQPMNMFRFGSQPLQQSQMIAPTRINTGRLSGGAAANDASIGKMS